MSTSTRQHLIITAKCKITQKPASYRKENKLLKLIMYKNRKTVTGTPCREPAGSATKKKISIATVIITIIIKSAHQQAVQLHETATTEDNNK